MITRNLILASIAATVALSATAKAEPTFEIVPASEVTFQPLNPLRGDASPKAGVLWGDIKQDVPTGTLLEFADGFSSPPHIHNITYRAVVISGSVHNDDPEAVPLWMGPGSFWTQPAGENHITAAKPGGRATAFLEILEGPYLVQPATEEFDNGERPINLEARNVVWLDASASDWIEQPGGTITAEMPQIAYLWGSTQEGDKNGTFLRLPSGFQGAVRGNDAWLRAVVAQGKTSHQASDAEDAIELETGSYFGGKGGAVHTISCISQDECLLYIRTEGAYAVSES